MGAPTVVGGPGAAHVPIARWEDLDGRLGVAVDALLLVALSLGHGGGVCGRFDGNGNDLQYSPLLASGLDE
jgi:hypothetical protein